MKTKERLELFIEHLNSTPGGFEKECGISNGYIKNIRESIGTSVLERILKRYPELNKLWLLHGEGEMLINQNIKDENEIKYQVLKPTKKNKIELSDSEIPFYDVDFAAGDIEMFNDSPIKADYTMDIPDFRGCIAFRTYGESMDKLIKNGDIVFATKIEDWISHLEYGQIYGIVCKDNRRYLKYIRKATNKDETHFLLRSENAEFDDFIIPKTSIKSIWLIHGYMNKRT